MESFESRNPFQSRINAALGGHLGEIDYIRIRPESTQRFKILQGLVETSEAVLTEVVKMNEHSIGLHIDNDEGRSFTYWPREDRLETSLVSKIIISTNEVLQRAGQDTLDDFLKEKVANVFDAVQEEKELGLHAASLEDWGNFAYNLENFIPRIK